MRHRSARSIFFSCFLTAAAFAVACGEGRQSRQPPTDRPPETAPEAAPDPAAERQTLRLTGCLKSDTTPGRYVLTSVATAGHEDVAGEKRKPRSWAAEEKADPEGRGSAMAASSYQVIPEEGEDLATYRNARVTVTGRLAAGRPTGTSGRADASSGKEVQRDTTGSKVVADAPPLRALYVESVAKVDDRCE